jgi:hypothetical protein
MKVQSYQLHHLQQKPNTNTNTNTNTKTKNERITKFRKWKTKNENQNENNHTCIVRLVFRFSTVMLLRQGTRIDDLLAAISGGTLVFLGSM